MKKKKSKATTVCRLKKTTICRTNPPKLSKTERMNLLKKRLTIVQKEVDELIKAGTPPGSTLGLIVYGEYFSLKHEIDDLFYEDDEDSDK